MHLNINEIFKIEIEGLKNTNFSKFSQYYIVQFSTQNKI